MVMGSATLNPIPSNCTVAPALTVVAPATSPNAALFFTSITPVLTVVNPV
ncbi:unannotated protein [freshwater metagenome]|uniref:Unannotated protein n=1 Tax=freshwater metagenome TaxID=449393 RepID=A0A6J6ZTV4_9ZZZZ